MANPTMADLIDQLEANRVSLEQSYDLTDDQDARADIAEALTQLGVELHECELTLAEQDDSC